MVRREQNLGLALLLLAGLCLSVRDVAAQTAASSSAPVTTAAATNTPAAPAASSPAPRGKAPARHKKAAPEPPPPATPAAPPTLEQTSPTPPQVTYNGGQLTIIAQNATLSQVLRSVQSQTGASVDMPSAASSERVVGQLGPGQPRDVLNALLNGSKFNYIILGVAGDPGAVQKVILTTPKPASAVNTAQSTPPAEQPPDEENEPEPQPPTPLPPQFRHRPNMPGRQPEGFNPPQAQPQAPLPTPTPIPAPQDNSGDSSQLPGGKTPEQLLQELQQMQQQQQQMQEQLNPANRQPPQ